VIEKTQEVELLKIKGRLPVPKGVALAIMEICRRDDATIAEIAKVVQSDKALSARLIRLANSGANTGRPVNNIPDAIVRLGLSAVRLLALGFSLVDQYSSGPCQAFDYTRFWSHSLLMAVACQQLGGYIKGGSPDELFACGLLARIGCLALATVYPAEYAELLVQQDGDSDADTTLLELERERLHVDHNELTATILASCDIPASLVEPVCYHETPDASGFAEGSRPYQLTHLFNHAKRLADLGLTPETERYSKTSELMLLGSKIGLDADKMGAEVDRIFLQWHTWGELLKVRTSTTPAFARMAATPSHQPHEERVSNQLRVLLADDDASSRLVMEGILGRMLGRPVHSAGNGEEALAKARDLTPQIVVTNRLMPVMNGIEFCRGLRAAEWGQFMYVIILSEGGLENEMVEAFEAGANDYITRPVNILALNARIRAALHYVKLLGAWERDRAQLKRFAAELASSNSRLEKIELTDLLTGLPNRRAGMNALSKAWLNANRSGESLSVIMIDIDHFKSINERYGHALGDVVLKEVAMALQAKVRGNDVVCYMGGEKFFVICHNADPASACRAAERLHAALGSLNIKIDTLAIQITASIGVASKEPEMLNGDAMLEAADKAIHAAKNSGRDRIFLISQNRIHHPTSGAHPEFHFAGNEV
jgi:diguanylate cyclase (GGDEF)-like protein